MNKSDSKTLNPPKSRKWWVLAAVCFGLFMSLLDGTIVNVALPTIQKSLNASFSDLQWVIDAYNLAFAVVLVTSSRLGDIFGRKIVFISGLSLFIIGSLLCACSGSFTFGNTSHITTLIVSRAIQAIGGSAMAPLSLSIISTEFSSRERGAAIGIWSGISGIATAIGPVIGGYLVQHINWQFIFLINVPIGIAGIALSIWAMRESKADAGSSSIDVFGLVSFSIGMTCLILALMQGNDIGWNTSYILMLFIIAAFALVIFIIGELKVKNPMIDPRLFKISSFTGSAIAGFCVSAGLYSLFFYLSLYLQNYLGFDSFQTGLRFLPLSVFVLIGAPLSGKYSGKYGPKWFVVITFAILSVAVFMMSRISPQNTAADWIVLLPGFILAGIANGMVNPPIASLAVGTVHPSSIGMASGINNVSRQVGGTFGVAFLGAMLSLRYNSYISDAINALHSTGLPAAAKADVISGIQKAGAIAGSLGLPGNAIQVPSLSQTTLSEIQGIARAAFVNGTIDVLRIAGIILAAGAILSFILIKNKDMYSKQQKEEAANCPKIEDNVQNYE